MVTFVTTVLLLRFSEEEEKVDEENVEEDENVDKEEENQKK